MERDPWHYGTWEGARDATREANLQLSLADKIKILEDMQQMTLLFHRQRQREGLPVDPKIAPLLERAVAEEPASFPPPPASPPPTS